MATTSTVREGSTSKELKGSKNFDFYRDPKTGDIFIKGNKSKDMIKINLDKFLK